MAPVPPHSQKPWVRPPPRLAPAGLRPRPRPLPGRSRPCAARCGPVPPSGRTVPLGGGEMLAWPRLWQDPKLRPPPASCVGRSSPGRILPHCPTHPREAFGPVSAGHPPCRPLKRPDVTLLERRRSWGCCWVLAALACCPAQGSESCSPDALPPRDTELSAGCGLWAAAPACLVGVGVGPGLGKNTKLGLNPKPW